MKLSVNQLKFINWLLHGCNLYFLGYLFFLVFTQGFGADPVEGITHYTGIAGLNTLILTLCLSPIAKILNLGSLIKFRRVMGLYCFFWATLHLFTYLILNIRLDLHLFFSELIQRPYLTLGGVAWIILFVLAITSFQFFRKKVGQYWQMIHYAVYLVLLLVPIHFYWSKKSELIEPSIYLAVSVVLLALRWKTLKKIYGLCFSR